MLQRLSLALFILSSLLPWTLAVPGVKLSDGDSVVSKTTDYPSPNQGNIPMHDPSIVEYGGYFYIFRGGIHLPIFKSSNLDGPWTKIGTVFDGPSVIEKENRTRPWAPTTVQHNGMFYCFYTLSSAGVRNSAIGVATTDRIDTDGGGSWTDHGALINTEHGPLSQVYPYTVSNAIDASFITDQKTGQAYLLYGSYWQGIFQLPLSDDLLSIAKKKHPNSAHLVSLPDEKPKAIEGSFMSYREPYYYLWYSRGKCCGFAHGFPKKGKEYHIRVGRSTHVRGPFLDKTGRQLLDGGGTVVYGSNHGDVYAPGGIGVLPENDKHQDILYYHYMNTTIGFLDPDSRLGYSYLEYVDGWPEARATSTNRSSTINAKYAMNLLVLMCMCYLILNVFRQRFSGPRLILVPAWFLVIWVLIWIY